MYRHRKTWLWATTVLVLAGAAVATPAHAEQYTRSSCGGGYKDPINLLWQRHWNATDVSNNHKHTNGMCTGHLTTGGDSCGTQQSYKYTTTCRNSYRRHCNSRSNHRRIHVRLFDHGYKFVPAHEDQGCWTFPRVYNDGARFNPGRDNQYWWVGTGCRPGGHSYWGNTMSIKQACGVGNQASDGWVAYIN